MDVRVLYDDAAIYVGVRMFDAHPDSIAAQLALGLQVPVRQSYEPNDPASDGSFGPVLRGWRDIGLDAIFLAGEVPSAAHVIVAAREQGLTIPILGGDAMSSPELISVGGAAAEGTVVATAFHPDEPRPEVRRFTVAFEKRFGVQVHVRGNRVTLRGGYVQTMARVRWRPISRARRSDDPRVMDAAFSYEGAADEASFVLGPAAVLGVAAATTGRPW